MTHRDGFPRLSARSAWRGDAGHRKPCGTPSESPGKPPVRSRGRTGSGRIGGASESLDEAPHRPRLPSYPPVGPADRLPDLYGSLSAFLGITPRSLANKSPNPVRREARR